MPRGGRDHGRIFSSQELFSIHLDSIEEFPTFKPNVSPESKSLGSRITAIVSLVFYFAIYLMRISRRDTKIWSFFDVTGKAARAFRIPITEDKDLNLFENGEVDAKLRSTVCRIRQDSVWLPQSRKI